MITEAAARICEGGGWNVGSATITEEEGVRRSICPYCGRNITVNRYGTLRKHDDVTKTMVERGKVPEKAPKPPEISLLDMHDEAATLKAKLRECYESTKDPRFKRLWQHAHALDIHLFKMHVDKAFCSSTSLLAAMRD